MTNGRRQHTRVTSTYICYFKVSLSNEPAIVINCFCAFDETKYDTKFFLWSIGTKCCEWHRDDVSDGNALHECFAVSIDRSVDVSLGGSCHLNQLMEIVCIFEGALYLFAFTRVKFGNLTRDQTPQDSSLSCCGCSIYWHIINEHSKLRCRYCSHHVAMVWSVSIRECLNRYNTKGRTLARRWA